MAPLPFSLPVAKDTGHYSHGDGHCDGDEDGDNQAHGCKESIAQVTDHHVPSVKDGAHL